MLQTPQNRCLNTVKRWCVVTIHWIPWILWEKRVRQFHHEKWPVIHQCIHLKMDSGVLLYEYGGRMEQIYIYRPEGSRSSPACAGKHRMTQLIHLCSIMTAGLERVWEKGKRFWWMTFRVQPLAIAKSPSPHRPQASYLLLREKWMNAPL